MTPPLLTSWHEKGRFTNHAKIQQGQRSWRARWSTARCIATAVPSLQAVFQVGRTGLKDTAGGSSLCNLVGWTLQSCFDVHSLHTLVRKVAVSDVKCDEHK